MGGRRYLISEKTEKPARYLAVKPDTATTQLAKTEEALKTEQALLDSLSQRNYLLMSEKFVDKLLLRIKTAEDYYNFEQLLYSNRLISNKIYLQKIRPFGKEINGVAEQQKNFEKKYGVKLNIDDSNVGYSYTASVIPLESIKKRIQKLDEKLEMYPPIFLENSGLKKISLLTNIKDEEGITVGGFFVVGVGDITMENIGYAFDHELLHCADHNYGGLNDDDSTWVKRAHGKNYEEVYGKDKEEKAYESGKRPFGFAEWCGLTNPDEDQATILSAMMNVDKDVLNDIPVDPVLREKVKMTKEFYYTVSEGRMDPKFWMDLVQGKKIDRKYWEEREKKQDFLQTPELEKARQEISLRSATNNALRALRIPFTIYKLSRDN